MHPMESTLRRIAQSSKRESASGIVQRVKTKVVGCASHASAYPAGLKCRPVH